MVIKVGETLPGAMFLELGADGPLKRTVEDVFAGKKVVLFGLPGAFTPTCHKNHLPGFLENLDAIKARGVDTVAVVSVNDVWVMGAWAKETKGQGRIVFLADGSGDFTQAIGLEADIPGMGLRSRRYSMIVDDRVVRSLNIEEVRGQAVISGAATVLSQL